MNGQAFESCLDGTAAKLKEYIGDLLHEMFHEYLMMLCV